MSSSLTPRPEDRLLPETEVRDLLDAWREALRGADWHDPGTPERAVAELKARDCAERYHLAVLRMKGRLDQLEGAAGSTSDRIAKSQERIWTQTEQLREEPT